VRAAEPVTPGPGEPDETGLQSAGSIWPHVDRAIVETVLAHRSTIVFANSRRLAERLTAAMNELYVEMQAPVVELVETPGARVSIGSTAAVPAQVMGQSGQTSGAEPILARAHHGSVSKEQRANIEDDLEQESEEKRDRTDGADGT
jgi:ATP-dependent Lhr-like helicase